MNKSVLTALSAAAIGGIVFGATPAFAVDPVFTPPPPVVQILLDTSGSMQYDITGPASEDQDQDSSAVPTCSPTPGASGKSRYIVAAEVLAGTLDGYYCELQPRADNSSPYCPNPDCYSDVPHVAGMGTRQSDGLIDRSGAKFKFGVMTMDSNLFPGNGVGGGYSYGPEIIINLGAQNTSSPIGRLVKPSSSDTPASILAANADVKASILAARPFDGTPLGPFLYDAEYFFKNDAVFTGDPYKSCRQKHVILITDGRNNMGAGMWSYLDPVIQANRIRQLGFEVWVIAFNVADGLTSQAHDIATYYGSLPEDHYFLAEDSVGLATALYRILGNIYVISQSRTKTVFTNETGNTKDVQYQFNAAYANAPDLTGADFLPGVKQGILERSVYKCGVSSSSPHVSSLAEIQSIGEKLSATPDLSRNIYTMVEGSKESFISTNSNIGNSLLDAPDPATEPVPDFGRDSTTGWCKSGQLTGSDDEKLQTWRNNLFNYIRANEDSCRDGYKLGAIYHSTPALQTRKTSVSLSIPSFAAYKTSIASRPNMLYVATHDGMMHAFRFDRESGTTTPDYWGKELWAYIPAHVLGSLKDLPDGKETVLDGAPVVADIVMSRTNASRDSESDSAWKSVLLFGDRAGGLGYTAIDVTDPEDGDWSVLWEVSATMGRCVGGSSDCNVPGGAGAYKNDFSRLGKTFGRPVIGTVMICPSPSGTCQQSLLEEVAVAVFGGGSSDGVSTIGAGRTAFVVRLDTGEKIAEFASGDGDGDDSNVISDCAGLNNIIDADIVGDMSCMSTLAGTFLTRCFVGDSAGRLWKIEIGSTSRANWKMSLFYDPYDTNGLTIPVSDPSRAPAYEAPALSLTPRTNEPVIVYGGGDMDDLLDTTKKSFIVSLTETVVTTEPADCTPWEDNVCFRSVTADTSIGPDVNWKMFFGYDPNLVLVTGEPAGQRLMGAPIIYGGVAYFTTFMPSTTNVCIPGLGRLYGVDYILDDGTCDQPKPRLPSESDPLTFETWMSIGTTSTGSVPYGVVVVNRPACVDGESIGEAGSPYAAGSPLGDPGSSGAKLVVQTGLNTGENPETPAQGTTDRTIQQILRNAGKAIESIMVGTWGSVFD